MGAHPPQPQVCRASGLQNRRSFTAFAIQALGPLITSCWHVDPAQRPTMSACCEQLLTLFQAMGRGAPNLAEVGHPEVLVPVPRAAEQQQPDQRGPDTPAECSSSDRTPAPVLVPDAEAIAAREPV